MSAATVSVVILTQRRPLGLEAAMRSVFAQTVDQEDRPELIVVDNDQTPSAQGLVGQLSERAPFTVSYVHESRPGVASARNAAMRHAQAPLVVFLDDDQVASAGWLAALLRVQRHYAADAVFGPVYARAPANIGQHREYFERFFSRLGPNLDGVIDEPYGCGNSLLRRSALPNPTTPFDEARNQIGGEDNLLFQTIKGAGVTFAWSSLASVWEDPAPTRLCLSYTIRRAFAFGQAPTSDCAAANPPDRLGVVRWMIIGLGQAAVFGLIAAGQWLVGVEGRAVTLDRAARGLGKALWWGPFRIQFYGHAA